MAEIKNWEKKYAPFFAIGLILAGIFLTTAFSSRSPQKLELGNIKGDVGKIFQSCEALGNKEQCYAKAFENLTKATDRDYAFTVLRTLQQKDPEARGCHFIAHAISTAETQKDPSQWRALMNTAPSDCSYGAAHGALEVYASTFPGGQLPKAELPGICDNPDLNNCTHALGHLILVMNEDDIDQSVKDCGLLPHDSLGRFECLTGVFMERITAINLEIHGLAGPEALNWPARVPELEALCRKQTGASSIACWKEIVHAVLIKVNNDTQKLVDFCERAPGEQETRQCIDHSLGIIAASYNFDLSRMSPICEATVREPGFKDRCYAHLVSATISTIPQAVPAAVNFCANIASPYQESCFTMIGNSLYRGNPEQKALLARECALAPKNLRLRCEQGGNTTVQFYSGN